MPPCNASRDTGPVGHLRRGPEQKGFRETSPQRQLPPPEGSEDSSSSGPGWCRPCPIPCPPPQRSGSFCEDRLCLFISVTQPSLSHPPIPTSSLGLGRPHVHVCKRGGAGAVEGEGMPDDTACAPSGSRVTSLKPPGSGPQAQCAFPSCVALVSSLPSLSLGVIAGQEGSPA